jgi:epoxyqueuosine reductase
LDEEQFRIRFRGRAITRAKRDGLARNACIALGNVGTPDDLPVAEKALNDSSPLVRGHSAWAVSRLAARHGFEADGLALLEKALAREEDSYARDELRLAIKDLSGVSNG